MSAELREIARRVTSETGIVVGETGLPALAAAVVRIGSDTGSVAAALRDPWAGTAVFARLLDEYTVKETSFFRDRSQLDAIDWPALFTGAQADGRSAVRVWCAGCATGEEAYTLAVLAAEALGSVTRVSILATDVSGAAIRHAAAGRYRPRPSTRVDEHTRLRWAVPDGEAYVARDELRARIDFAEHNLVRDPIPPNGAAPFDLIVCRNVLIYFAPETAMSVTTAVQSTLASGGKLLLGASDVLCLTSPALAALAAALPASWSGSGSARRPGRRASKAPNPLTKGGSDVQPG